jgi:NAD+ synthase
MSARTDAIVEWLRQRLARSGAKGFLVGIGGDAGTAVVAALCRAAAPGKVIAVLLPCHGDAQADTDARLVTDQFDLPALRIDLAPAHDVLIEDLAYAAEHLPDGHAAPEQLPMANVKPRLRMTTMSFLAEALNYLVAGSINRSELAIGGFTPHGDGSGDVLPIGHLLHREVSEIAVELGVPDAIVVSMARGFVWRDERFTYSDLENYLTNGPEAVAPALAMRIERLIRQSEQTRALPPIPELI